MEQLTSNACLQGKHDRCLTTDCACNMCQHQTPGRRRPIPKPVQLKSWASRD